MRMIALLALAWSTALGAAGLEARLGPAMENPGYEEKPAWFKQSFLDIREDVADAAAEGRRVMLYFYQDGCPYCAKLLQDNFSQSAIEENTRRHFDVIAINLWGDREVTDFQGNAVTEKQFGADLRVLFTPTLLMLDEQGRALLRLNGYYPPHQFSAALDYAAGEFAPKERFSDYLKTVAPMPASGKLHREPGFLAAPLDLRAATRPGDRPLLALFEQKQCPACDELHGDILRREAVRRSFGAFDVALLDIWSDEPVVTPAGDAVQSRQWARSLGVNYAPSLLFFDGSGNEVFRVEAYLKTFHVHAALDFVASGAYRDRPNFQRFVQARANALRAQGIEPDLME
jgi:thioredoxin-related protein